MSSTASHPPSATLTITVWEDAGAAPQQWRLTCDPAGGDHPDPETACRALTGVSDPFSAVPSDRRCAQIYFGPQRAVIEGMWHGRPVQASYSRTDSCQEERWQELVEVFGSGRP